MMDMIGHPEAKRELTPRGWKYADAANRRLAVALVLLGANLAALDEFIERMESEGAGAGLELRERRRKALQIFLGLPRGSKLLDSAFAGHIEWIMQRKREIEKSDFVQPYIDDGEKKRATDKKKSRAMVSKSKEKAKANAEQNRKVFEMYAELRSHGTTGAAKLVGRKFGLAPGTVSNIVSRIQKQKGAD